VKKWRSGRLRLITLGKESCSTNKYVIVTLCLVFARLWRRPLRREYYGSAVSLPAFLTTVLSLDHIQFQKATGTKEPTFFFLAVVSGT